MDCNYDKLKSTVKLLQKPAPDDTRMMDISGYAELDPDQKRFSRELLAYPRLFAFWDFKKRECDVAALTDAIPGMSSGEKTLARFFLAVWTNDDSQVIDLLKVAELGDADRTLIADWLLNPYWP